MSNVHQSSNIPSSTSGGSSSGTDLNQSSNIYSTSQTSLSYPYSYYQYFSPNDTSSYSSAINTSNSNIASISNPSHVSSINSNTSLSYSSNLSYPYQGYPTQYYSPTQPYYSTNSTSLPSYGVPLSAAPQIISKAPVSYANAVKTNISTNSSTNSAPQSKNILNQNKNVSEASILNWRAHSSIPSIKLSASSNSALTPSNIPPWQRSKETKNSAPQYTSVSMSSSHEIANPSPISTQSFNSKGKKISKWSSEPNDQMVKSKEMDTKSQNITSWPDSLKTYVSRAFESCECSDVDKNTMEIILKEMILEAVQNNTLYSTDWSSIPLPFIKKEKNISNITNMNDSQPLSKTKKKNKNNQSLSLSKEEKISLPFSHSTLLEIKKKEDRAKRFETEFKTVPVSSKSGNENKNYQSSKYSISHDSYVAKDSSTNVNPFNSSCEDWWDALTIIGTSTQLEKQYLRLTSAPDPSTVRPLPVLIKSLKMILDKYKKIPNLEYNYICGQFKSIRQDLTVQRIRNFFTIAVYETHARIALEKNDIGEYNKCQTQLKSLYFELLTPDERDGVFVPPTSQINISEKINEDFDNKDEYSLSKFPPHPLEFLSYRILYFLYTQNHAECSHLISELTVLSKSNPCVFHALAVRDAISQNDYVSFFQLYRKAPGMSPYLMDAFVGRERLKAMKTICSSYRPNVKLKFVYRLLAFDTLIETLEWLKVDCQVEFIQSSLPSSLINTIHSSSSLSASKLWYQSKDEDYFVKNHPDRYSELENIQIDTKASILSIHEKYINTHSKIDIKGQI